MPRKKKIHKKASLVLGHHHSGKLLHKQHTSYATLVMMLLFIGVLMTAINFSVRAADLSVRASIIGQAPTQPAKITSPANGKSFSDNPVSVQGTCQAKALVKMYRNNVFAGAVLCDKNGFFDLRIDLLEGNNRLIAKTYNSANQAGPDSSPVIVMYAGSKTVIQQPFISTDYKYEGFSPGQTVVWKINLKGGQAPYGLSVDWGDGNSQVHSILQDGPYELRHSYDAEGGYLGSYTITIRVSDADGNKSFMQLLVIVNDTDYGGSGFMGPLGSSDGGVAGFISNSSVAIAWPMFIFSLLLLLSFWLGERRERHILMRRIPTLKT